jgi:3-oxoadipate enol-lactonase
MPYLQRGDARIWWRAGGTGEPVLLIMGLGYPSDMWHRTAPALRRAHRVVRFDNRGVGRTGVPPGPYPVPVLADDAAAVLAAAGESRAHVVGLSLGGIIAQQLALAHPEVVRSLTLLATHPGGPHALPPEPEVSRLLTARATMSPQQAAEAALPYIYAASTDPARIAADLAVRNHRPTSPAGYQGQLSGALAYPGAYPELGSIRVPTLVVHGVADRLVPPGNAALIAGAVPGARLVLLERASHILITDRTRAVNRLLLDFLAQPPPGP